tara:strand:+ start:264 stop:1088 length:825 start_codon:yes stop_codon:yes gene_type:complete
MKFNFLLINLKGEKGRLINAIDELYSIEQSDSIIRIEACDKKKAEAISYQYISQKAEENIKNPICTGILPNYSAVGCAISHIKCWRYILDNNLESGLIVEDDIKINDVKKFKNNLWNINIFINNHKDKNLFLVFNSRRVNNKNNYNYNDYNCSNDFNLKNNNFDKIKDMFIGTHFYYINRNMAKFLHEKIINMDYQIDLEIGKLAGQYFWDKTNLFINYNTNALTINNKFKTSIQFYVISINELIEIFSISEDIANCIYQYIPYCFKKSRDNIM